MASLDQVRRFYAEELRHVAPAHSPLIVEAFATVPRERFLDPGPWRILPGRGGKAWTTEDDDPRHLYHNVLIPIETEPASSTTASRSFGRSCTTRST